MPVGDEVSNAAALLVRLQVRRLRVLCYFAAQALPLHSPPNPLHLTIAPSPIDAPDTSNGPSVGLYISSGAPSPSSPPFIQLTGLRSHLFLPLARPPSDERSLRVLSSLPPTYQAHGQGVLGHVLDYYFGDVLCPAVLLCDDEGLLSALVGALASLPGLHTVRGVDAATDRIVKSLYDGPEVGPLHKGATRAVLVISYAETSDRGLVPSHDPGAHFDTSLFFNGAQLPWCPLLSTSQNVCLVCP